MFSMIFLLFRIVCFDIDTGEMKKVVTNPDMQNVYTIEYDSVNQVIQAAAGLNNGAESFGFTFSAKVDNFGELLQKWNDIVRDLRINLAFF